MSDGTGYAAEEGQEDKGADEKDVYLHKCKVLNILPRSALVTRRRADGFEMSHYGAGDKAVQALASGLRLMSDIKVMSLKDNRIEGQGAEDIIASLKGNTTAEVGIAVIASLKGNATVESIDLSSNQIGRLGVTALSTTMITMRSLRVLNLASNKLNDSETKELNLSHNYITSSGSEAIAAAIDDTRRRVKKQAETLPMRVPCALGIAGPGGTRGSLESLDSWYTIRGNGRESGRLEYLDLSWNAIRGVGAAALGLALVDNRTLRRLNLAWNGVGGSKAFDVWAGVFEKNVVLEELDLSHNSLDERNTIVIAENVRTNEVMTNLQLSDNPLGPIGAKLMFKLMDAFGADRKLVFENCNFDAKSKHCPIDPADIQGDFSLDLSQPYERACAKALVRIAGKNIADQWQNCRLNGSPFNVKNFDGSSESMPESGILSACYYKLIQRKAAHDVVSEQTFSQLHKMISADDTNEIDRLALVIGVAGDLTIDCKQLCKMVEAVEGSNLKFCKMVEAVEGSNLKVGLVKHMFSRLVDRNNFSSVSDSLSQEELAALKRELGALWSYTDSNPTGHYRLDLSRPFDRNLALKVLETNNMERGWRRMADLFDTSDDGFYMNFRNETIDAKSFTWNGVWRIPATGILDFDYVSTERPPFHTPPLDNDLFRELVEVEGSW
ncbi:hypothetical protein T484DRAFT_1834834 [Baffinella frigidus]|nr:hypothetical protein T484DRAFT_1834834 [Cryptophyta sp. CCMP2293]